MTAKRARDGKGGKAYRRASKRLKRETALNGLVCVWCGQPIDTALPRGHALSFTADHPEALVNGGALVGQVLEPMHRRCNTLKGKTQGIEEDEWGAT